MQIRQFHTTISRLVRGVGRRSNPGVGHQVTGIEHAAESLASDPEGFGDMETDFMEIQKSHREHEMQMEKQRDRIRQKMIKHKYFREAKLPNLLTYAEKEQMRLLHARDPEEWTAERLAESFPTTPDIAEKILNAKWQAKDKYRIRKHDEVVMRNWEQLRTEPNKLQLPPGLKEHLQRFATRRQEDIAASAYDWKTRSALPKPKQQEFLSIISSCNKYEETKRKQLESPMENKRDKNNDPLPTADLVDETYLLEKVHDKRPMRLQELKETKLTPADLAAMQTINYKSEQQKIQQSNTQRKNLELNAVQTLQNPSGSGVLPSTSTPTDDWSVVVQKYESTEIIINAEDQQRYEITRVKDRIYIPRKLWRKGGTFRVEDCYYDDDGEFLYRVPGMTGQAK